MGPTARSAFPTRSGTPTRPLRISEGVSVFQLAANMGTSVEMIENFYGKKRMRDPKMATEVTKFSASTR